MEINRYFEMLPIPKSIGHLPDSFDLGVKTFTHSIGYPLAKVRQKSGSDISGTYAPSQSQASDASG